MNRSSKTRYQLELLETRMLLAGDLAGVYGDSAELVDDLNTIQNSIRIGAVAQLNDTLQVIVNDGNGDIDLWQVDGPVTSRSAEIAANVAPTFGTCCAWGVVGDRLYFSVDRVWDDYEPNESYFVEGHAEIWSTTGAEESLDLLQKLGDTYTDMSILP